MQAWRLLALVAFVFMGWVGNASGQQNRETCGTVFEEVFESETGGDACQLLALRLVAELTNDFWTQARADANIDATVGTGDVQPTASGSSSAAGSLGQSEVVSSGQPLAIGGGSVSAVGSDAGADAITALTFNPSIFVVGDPESVARWSRATDFTVFFPVDNLDRDEDGDIDYFGFRFRINVNGLFWAGPQVWDKARAEFESLLARETQAATALLRNFGSMTEATMRECAGAIMSRLGPEAVAASCGAGVTTPTSEDYEEFRAELDQVRTQADSRYFGLDVRLESGDPTLGAVKNAEATALTAGLAFGKQFVGSATDPLAPSWGIRGWAGLRYTDLRKLDETSYAVDGGLAFVVKRPVTITQALILSGGVAFRFGGVEGEWKGELQSKFISARAALSVPVTEQTAVSVSFAYPLEGNEVSPTLTVTGDWKLLLPSLLQVR